MFWTLEKGTKTTLLAPIKNINNYLKNYNFLLDNYIIIMYNYTCKRYLFFGGLQNERTKKRAKKIIII